MSQTNLAKVAHDGLLLDFDRLTAEREMRFRCLAIAQEYESEEHSLTDTLDSARTILQFIQEGDDDILKAGA